MSLPFNITFLKKYLYGFTSENEEVTLMDHPEIKGQLAKAWDNYSDLKSKNNKPDSDKIYNSIQEKANIPENPIYNIDDTYPYRYAWYRSSAFIAAVVTLFVSFAIFSIYIYKKQYANPWIEIVSEKGQRKELTLPDGSRVWLNADTKIRYQKNFNAPVREVLLCGEAYFNVVKDATRPFIVKTISLDIKVLGTVFNVKSYPGDKTIETTLVTGLVSIEKTSLHTKSKEAPILVKPKQKAIFSFAADQIKVESVNVDKTTSWRSGKLVFDNETIDDVISKLQRWYGLNVKLMSRKNNTDRYTFTIKDENIDEVIKLLQLTSRISLKVTELDGSNPRNYETKTLNYELDDR